MHRQNLTKSQYECLNTDEIEKLIQQYISQFNLITNYFVDHRDVYGFIMKKLKGVFGFPDSVWNKMGAVILSQIESNYIFDITKIRINSELFDLFFVYPETFCQFAIDDICSELNSLLKKLENGKRNLFYTNKIANSINPKILEICKLIISISDILGVKFDDINTVEIFAKEGKSDIENYSILVIVNAFQELKFLLTQDRFRDQQRKVNPYLLRLLKDLRKYYREFSFYLKAK